MNRALILAAIASFSSASMADIQTYAQDFEALNAGDAGALGADGWLVGANVFSPGGGFLYNYFAFPAPNGSGAFSNIATGQGGPAQGNQQLVTFSDYNNGDHAIGNIIEAFFFRDYSIGAANVGQTWTFTFDYKRGDLAGGSTAQAYVRTLDPNAGFATTSSQVFETTNASTLWSTASISVLIDSSMTGQLFQIGFITTATNFEPSGTFYDNISLTVPTPGAAALLGLGGLMAARRRR